MGEPISPPPVRDYLPSYLPAYLSNGLLGLRAEKVPFLGGSAILNGFAGADPTTGIEGFARIPYPLAGDVEMAGVRASSAADCVRFIEQRYDFARAELTTELRYEIGDCGARLTVTTACSRRLPSVVLQQIRVRVDSAVDVALIAGLNPTGVGGRCLSVEQPPSPAPTGGVDGSMAWLSEGGLNRAGLAYATQLDVEAERFVSPHDQRGMAATTYRFRGEPGRTYTLRHYAAAVPELSHHQPAQEAARLVALAIALGWERLRAEDLDRWRELWRGRIEIDANDGRWQELADAALFYLLTSTHASAPASTSLFGLAFWPNYDYYGGHVMWDIETFTVPPLLLLNPPAARALLEYRVRHLGAARQNARLLGWAGAEYPWQSCPIHGEEVTIGSRPPQEEHVGLDVALALARYVFATADTSFLRDDAYPVLTEIALWLTSRVSKSERGYEIGATIGPAEPAGPVDNDAFVNMAAAQALREISAAARMIDREPNPLWEQIASGLVLARDGDVVANWDGWSRNRPGWETPCAAAGIWPVGHELPPDVERATLRFATEQQAPSYAGKPMLSSLLPVFAVRAGLPDRAAELLERGYADFIDPPFRMTDEFPRDEPGKPRANPMFANLGGFLMTLLYGYPGLTLRPGGAGQWPSRPVALPRGWRGIHVERLWAEQRAVRLEAVQGMERARLVEGT